MLLQPPMLDQVIFQVEQVLSANPLLTRNQDNTYTNAVYVDYRDRLVGPVLREVFKRDKPERLLSALLSDWYANCEHDCKKSILNDIAEQFHADSYEIIYHAYEHEIEKWLNEHLRFSYPYGHFMDQELDFSLTFSTSANIPISLLPACSIRMSLNHYFRLMDIIQAPTEQANAYAENCPFVVQDEKLYTVFNIEGGGAQDCDSTVTLPFSAIRTLLPSCLVPEVTPTVPPLA